MPLDSTEEESEMQFAPMSPFKVEVKAEPQVRPVHAMPIGYPTANQVAIQRPKSQQAGTLDEDAYLASLQQMNSQDTELEGKFRDSDESDAVFL